MARDEMNEVTEDRWDDDVWGTAMQGTTNLFFYFGKNDHWVADKTRDDLVAARGCSVSSRTKMVIDEVGVPHAFCISKL